MNIDKAFLSAAEYYRSGNLQAAESIYKKILKKQSNNVKAIHFLGIVNEQLGNYDSAMKYLTKAVQLNPHLSEAFNQMGVVLQKQGKLDESIKNYNKAVQINPRFVDGFINMGVALREKGELENALSCYHTALQISPHNADLYNNIGVILRIKGRIDEAIVEFQKALQGNSPNLPQIYDNLANCYIAKRQFDDAIQCCKKALQSDSRFVNSYINMGVALREKGELDEAIACYQTAHQISPNNADVCNNLGNIYKEQGRVDEAERYYRYAVQIRPGDAQLYSNLLLLINYCSHYDANGVFSEHVQFSKKYCEPLSSSIILHDNDRAPLRPLRIGYVSSDFKKHSVAYFLEPVISGHDRESFEIFRYSDVVMPDEVTARIQAGVKEWRNIVGMSDANAAELIRNDAIDILVDLAGHTANNRMLIFARKPAPVQVSWIGYPATTGLSTIDYKIVDSHTDPPGMTEGFYVEKLIRPPDCFLCYLPDKEAAEPKDLPALTTKHITFGSFNNFAKVSHEVFSLWIQILKNVPKAHLILKYRCFSDAKTTRLIEEQFEKNGISEDRAILLPFSPSTKEHLEMYHRIDIALDTFPYNGTTTTCEALWMGVPVITLAGNTHASRVGVSLLSNVGVPELIAGTPEEYVSIAVELAQDSNRLNLYRRNLRNMMTDSPLTDSKRFTANLERSFRQMWKTWCESISVVR